MGKAARSVQLRAIRLRADANFDGDLPAKRAAATAKNELRGRDAGSTMFRVDDVRAGIFVVYVRETVVGRNSL